MAADRMKLESPRELIKKLADREQKRGELFLRGLDDGRWSPETDEDAAKRALVVDESNELEQRLHGRIGSWANCPPLLPGVKHGISVLQLLLYYPVLFVDFGAWGKGEFLANYGVTASQMAKLAREGLVIPSLYWFDSYNAAIRQDPNSHPSYESRDCDHLKELYKSDETGCRIASIRRRYLFHSRGLEEADPKNPPKVPKWAHLFELAVQGLDENSLLDATRERTKMGALTRLSNNYEYVRVLGKEDQIVKEWLQDFKKPLDVQELKKIDQFLNGLKTWYASPITASFGGTYNKSLQNHVNMQRVQNTESFLMVYRKGSWDVSSHLMGELLDNQMQQCLALLTRLRLRKGVETDDISPPPVPWPLENDDDLDYYIAFLKEHNSLRNEVEKNIEYIRSTDRKAETWQDYLESIRKLKRECNRANKIKGWAEYLGQGTRDVFFLGLGVAIGSPDLDISAKLIGAGLGMSAFEIAGSIGNYSLAAYSTEFCHPIRRKVATQSTPKLPPNS